MQPNTLSGDEEQQMLSIIFPGDEEAAWCELVERWDWMEHLTRDEYRELEDIAGPRDAAEACLRQLVADGAPLIERAQARHRLGGLLLRQSEIVGRAVERARAAADVLA